jgi:hypothetical protein
MEETPINSEKRFRQVAENINEVFWGASRDFDELIYVSPAYEIEKRHIELAKRTKEYGSF